MRSTLLVFVLILFFIPNGSAQTCSKRSANDYLNGLFAKDQQLLHGSTRFKSYSKRLKLIKAPMLKKLLPEYCFYITNFFGNDMEYWEVETALAFSALPNKKSLLLFSPVFTQESTDFLQLFYGLKTNDTIQNVTVAKEITNIFSVLTYKGHAKRIRSVNEPNAISFELWHSDLSWRIYDFHFDESNILRSINIKNGVGRQEMTADYRRN